MAAAPAQVEVPTITILSASQTGNARRLSEQLRDDLLAAKLNVNLVNAGDFKFKQIAQEKLLVVVTSTQGEGEPPEEGVALHKFLMSKKAPKMDASAFAVFGLGDTSYEFLQPGGERFRQPAGRAGCNACWIAWMRTLSTRQRRKPGVNSWQEILQARVPKDHPAAAAVTAAGSVNEIHSSPYTKEAPLTASFAVKPESHRARFR